MSKSLPLALAIQKKNKKKKMAEGGKAGDDSSGGGAETSTTGNKTKTGGSNPGGASTGGAGTVTITTGDKPPKSISVSNVGGKTDSRNAGGMDPSDEDDKMMMALGGAVEGPTHSGHPYNRTPGQPAKVPNNKRLPDSETMSDQWSKGNPPARKPDDARRPMSAYQHSNEWSDSQPPSRRPIPMMAQGGVVTTKPNAARPSQPSYESADLNARAARGDASPAQMAEYHEHEAAKYRAYANGGEVMPSGQAQETQEPMIPMRVPNDRRPPMDEYMADHFAQGGQVMPDEDEEKAGSIAEAIMAKRHRAVMDSQVDLDENSEEEGRSPYDRMNARTGNKEQYDDSQISAQPEDSNEKGDDREDAESDKKDRISAMRRKMKGKGA